MPATRSTKMHISYTHTKPVGQRVPATSAPTSALASRVTGIELTYPPLRGKARKDRIRDINAELTDRLPAAVTSLTGIAKPLGTVCTNPCHHRRAVQYCIVSKKVKSMADFGRAFEMVCLIL
jgi:hypothetical protein